MTTPPSPRRGAPVLTWARGAAEWMRRTIVRGGPGIRVRTSASGVVVSAGGGSAAADPPPFHPRAIRRAPGEAPAAAYLVAIAPGHLIERVAKESTDAVIVHVPTWSAATIAATPPVQIPMDAGQTAYLRYQTFDHGGIDAAAPVEIIVGSGLESTHHLPKNPGDSEGTRGDYHVPLFTLAASPGGGVRATVHQQSDIEHQTIWAGENTGSGARVFRRRNHAGGQWEFRTLTAGDGISVDERTDDILIALAASGGHLDLIIETLSYELDDGFLKSTGSSGATMLRWRDGLYVGEFAVMTGPHPGDDERPEPMPQLTVTHMLFVP